MATAILECRVCGKKYEACRNAKRIDGVFRWQDVACSPECGSIYLNLIRESRSKNRIAVASAQIEEAFALYESEYTECFDEEFFDDDEEDSDYDVEF